MKNKIFTIGIIIIIVLGACSSETKKKKKNTTYNLLPGKSIYLPIQNTDHYFSYFTFVLEQQDSTLLVRDNYYSNGINIYDWNTKKLKTNYFFDIDGPNGIGSFGGAAIYPIQPDSLLITTVTGITYITKGKEIKYAQKNIINNEIYRSYGLNPYKPIRYKNNIYFWRAADYTSSKPEFFECSLYFKFNMKDKTIKNLPIHFFKQKLNISNFLAETYFTQNKHHLIIGFRDTPVLIRYDMSQNKIKDTITPTGGTRFKIEFVANNDENEAKKLKNNNFYYSITYDRYRNVYYRFIFLPVKDFQTATNKFDFRQTMPFMIQTLDNKFQVIAENTYKAGLYNLYDYFVTKEGLWISENNFNNPDFDENKQKFKLFKLLKK